MAGIVGSPDFDSYLHSQKVPVLNSSFDHDLYILHVLLALDVGGNQILSVNDLSRTSGAQDMRWAGACRSPIEPLS
jgi:hypothetical protein